MEKRVTVKLESGLHARPAVKFLNLAKSFQSDIHVYFEDREVSAKSMVGVLALGVYCGASVLIRAEGSDAGEALEALGAFLAGTAEQSAGEGDGDGEHGV